jgi:hypothetical protein
MVGEAAIAMHCRLGPKVSYAGPAKFGKRLLGFNGCYGAGRSGMLVRTVAAGLVAIRILYILNKSKSLLPSSAGLPEWLRGKT